MRKLVLLVITLGAIGAAAPATAQISWSVGGGPTFDVGTQGGGLESGFNGQLSAELGIPVFPVALRLDGMINRLGLGDVDGDFQVLSGTANVVLKLPGIALVPYLVGGAGVYHVKTTSDGFGDASETYGGVNGGGGLRFGLGGFGAFAEARVHATSGGDTILLPLTFGLRF